MMRDTVQHAQETSSVCAAWGCPMSPGKAKRRELIASGEATEDDLFIFTGVPDRDPQSYVRFTINASGEWVR